MKSQLTTLKLGETIRTRVVDQLSSNELIINYKGDLIRVANETNTKVRIGDNIDLIVTALKPLQFRMAVHNRIDAHSPIKLDISG